MARREHGLLDKIAGLIPGYASFTAKESRRDADKALRDHVAATLDQGKKHLDDLVLQLTDEGALGELDDIDRLKRRVATCADSIRHVPYGESGLMDEVVVDEGDLQRVYEHDFGLLDQARLVAAALRDLGTDGLPEALRSTRELVDEMQAQVDKRDEILKEVF